MTLVVKGLRNIREPHGMNSKGPDRAGQHSRGIGKSLLEFMESWQPRQRKTFGMLNALVARLESRSNAHPEWAEYDLPTFLLAALHLVIENDRLTGEGNTEREVVEELIPLVAAQQPDGLVETHRAIAEAVVEVLSNAKGRRLRLRDEFIALSNGTLVKQEQNFAFVRSVGAEDDDEPVLKATPEGINVFHNLFTFDPSDRAAAERYRSDRMLRREDYDEVLTSVARRSAGVLSLRGEIEALIRQIRYNVRDVDYASQVIPKLNEALESVTEQVEAEERFAESVSEHSHHSAPDVLRLQEIGNELRRLISVLSQLLASGRVARSSFEEEQDRQLFTFRRITVSPQADLLAPALSCDPDTAIALLEPILSVWLGPREPQITNFANVVSRSTPVERTATTGEAEDPFEIGNEREPGDEEASEIERRLSAFLAGVSKPSFLSELVCQVQSSNDDIDVERLGWSLAIVLASAFGRGSRSPEDEAENDILGDGHVVVSTGEQLPETSAVEGDDLIVVPRTLRKEST